MMMPPYHGALLKGNDRKNSETQIYEQFDEISKVVAPYDNGEVDYEGMDRVIDYYDSRCSFIWN